VCACLMMKLLSLSLNVACKMSLIVALMLYILDKSTEWMYLSKLPNSPVYSSPCILLCHQESNDWHPYPLFDSGLHQDTHI
jgi:hypothetical protein